MPYSLLVMLALSCLLWWAWFAHFRRQSRWMKPVGVMGLIFLFWLIGVHVARERYGEKEKVQFEGTGDRIEAGWFAGVYCPKTINLDSSTLKAKE